MAGVTFSPAILLGQNASAQSDTLKTVNRLKEVVVRGYGAERNLKAPEMGRVSLSSNMIANLPVMFGEPDIVKALQTLPGVSQGMEGFTGLYVRGGDNDQNLFLYQGLPLYHVSHLGGIFSSFNVETVDRALTSTKHRFQQDMAAEYRQSPTLQCASLTSTSLAGKCRSGFSTPTST